jgi:hypothetical protein
VVSAKCIAHCPGLLAPKHACSSESAGGYERTFSNDYRPDAVVGGEKKSEEE